MSSSPRINHAKDKKITKDYIVAVRLPKGLLEELKDLQTINHFMDTSDEIRFIIRKYCIPSGKEEPALELQHKEKLINDLTRIIEGLKAGQVAK